MVPKPVFQNHCQIGGLPEPGKWVRGLEQAPSKGQLFHMGMWALGGQVFLYLKKSQKPPVPGKSFDF